VGETSVEFWTGGELLECFSSASTKVGTFKCLVERRDVRMGNMHHPISRERPGLSSVARRPKEEGRPYQYQDGWDPRRRVRRMGRGFWLAGALSRGLQDHRFAV